MQKLPGLPPLPNHGRHNSVTSPHFAAAAAADADSNRDVDESPVQLPTCGKPTPAQRSSGRPSSSRPNFSFGLGGGLRSAQKDPAQCSFGGFGSRLSLRRRTLESPASGGKKAGGSTPILFMPHQPQSQQSTPQLQLQQPQVDPVLAVLANSALMAHTGAFMQLDVREARRLSTTCSRMLANIAEALPIADLDFSRHSADSSESAWRIEKALASLSGEHACMRVLEHK